MPSRLLRYGILASESRCVKRRVTCVKHLTAIKYPMDAERACPGTHPIIKRTGTGRVPEQDRARPRQKEDAEGTGTKHSKTRSMVKSTPHKYRPFCVLFYERTHPSPVPGRTLGRVRPRPVLKRDASMSCTGRKHYSVLYCIHMSRIECVDSILRKKCITFLRRVASCGFANTS